VDFIFHFKTKIRHNFKLKLGFIGKFWSKRFHKIYFRNAEDNDWKSYYGLYESFVQGFSGKYPRHEVVRGAKLVISSLLMTGMTQETLKSIYQVPIRGNCLRAIFVEQS
jgi:hypothetical protein